MKIVAIFDDHLGIASNGSTNLLFSSVADILAHWDGRTVRSNSNLLSPLTASTMAGEKKSTVGTHHQPGAAPESLNRQQMSQFMQLDASRRLIMARSLCIRCTH